MGRLHCPTCSCGDHDTGRGYRTNPRAPFYGLVLEADELSLRLQREAARQTITRRKGTDDDDLPDAARLRAGQ